MLTGALASDSTDSQGSKKQLIDLQLIAINCQLIDLQLQKLK